MRQASRPLEAPAHRPAAHVGRVRGKARSNLLTPVTVEQQLSLPARAVSADQTDMRVQALLLAALALVAVCQARHVANPAARRRLQESPPGPWVRGRFPLVWPGRVAHPMSYRSI